MKKKPVVFLIAIFIVTHLFLSMPPKTENLSNLSMHNVEALANETNENKWDVRTSGDPVCYMLIDTTLIPGKTPSCWPGTRLPVCPTCVFGNSNL